MNIFYASSGGREQPVEPRVESGGLWRCSMATCCVLEDDLVVFGDFCEGESVAGGVDND